MADNTHDMVPTMFETIRGEQRAMHGEINKLATSHENLTAEVRISGAHVAALMQRDVHTDRSQLSPRQRVGPYRAS